MKSGGLGKLTVFVSSCRSRTMGLGSIVEQRKRKALEDPVKNIARSTNVRPRRGL